MTWHQSHLRQFSNIPSTYNESAAVWCFVDLLNKICNLVVYRSIRSGPRSPLFTVNWSEFTLLIGPLIPDTHPVFPEVTNVCFAFQKPQQFMNDTFQVKLFGCHHWKTFSKIKAHLISKNAPRASSGSVAFVSPAFHDMLNQIKVLLHITYLMTSSIILPTLPLGIWILSNAATVPAISLMYTFRCEIPFFMPHPIHKSGIWES